MEKPTFLAGIETNHEPPCSEVAAIITAQPCCSTGHPVEGVKNESIKIHIYYTACTPKQAQLIVITHLPTQMATPVGSLFASGRPPASNENAPGRIFSGSHAKRSWIPRIENRNRRAIRFTLNTQTLSFIQAAVRGLRTFFFFLFPKVFRRSRTQKASKRWTNRSHPHTGGHTLLPRLWGRGQVCGRNGGKDR